MDLIVPNAGSSREIKTCDKRDIKQGLNGQWRFVLEAIGIPIECLRNKGGPCPLCGGTDRFRFDDRDGHGTWYCNQCGSGDGLELYKRLLGLSFPDAIERLSTSFLVGTSIPLPPRQPPKPSEERTSEQIEQYRRWFPQEWDRCLPITDGSIVAKYLTSRYLRCDVPELRFCPRWNAMVARVSNPRGELVALHRTLLDADGKPVLDASGKKIKRLTRRLHRNALDGSAIRLMTATDTVILAEGIETALAASILFGGIPAWATRCDSALASVWLPETILNVIIAADNDKSEAGQKAAKRLRATLLAEGRRVKIELPAVTGTDWADVLRAGNHE